MVFVRSKSDESFNISAQLGLTPKKGEVGLEIEVEGNKFRKESLPDPWEYHQDGSLRGQDNAEYVLKEPQSFDAAEKAVDIIYGDMEKFGTVLTDSNRTSVHVHLNVGEFFLNRLAALMGLWIILEAPLTEWCGEHRVGNLFCLGAQDAPALVSHLRRFIQSDMTYKLREGLHYAGMNPHSITQMGSLEFRTLEGTKDPEQIKKWLRILRRLYDLSAEYPNPARICDTFSSEGPLAFFDSLLGDQATTVRRGISMSDDRLREVLYDSVRLSQDICYCRDWVSFKAKKVKPDPFGRNPGRVARRRRDGLVTPPSEITIPFQASNEGLWAAPITHTFEELNAEWQGGFDD
jgi:hypothetical protein